MRCTLYQTVLAIVAVWATEICLPPAMAAEPAGKKPARTNQAWTLDEAQQQLALNPRDPYLQYVVLQLARRENQLHAVKPQVEALVNRNNWQQRAGRRGQADLYSIFSGALAVQESLQLDSMTGAAARPPQKRVAVADLEGPTVKSHPWDEMLAGRDPNVSALSKLVPADQYLVETRSLGKLLELMETGDLWASHLFNQATQDATNSRVGERLREQLAVRSDPLTRPFYDLVVEGVAVTGSDLYLREGSDVTLLFRLKQPEVFKARMDGFLKESQQQHEGLERTTGEYLGVAYVKLATANRQVHVYSAYPQPNLHIRSNSQPAFERAIAAVRGQTRDGSAATPLGDTAEFKFIRTIMPQGAAEEDVFVYLSDPFIRRVVGPRLKITERRRLLAYNHLKMIGHAAMMYRTELGREPKSLADLVEARCAPALFGEGEFKNPIGGTYSLSADGTTGLCSASGEPYRLIPCDELPLDDVTQEEADEYQAFREDYNQYWRTYFDPIAVRVQMTPERYRIETIVLPLIDNSIYSSLAATLGGEPEPLDALPVPKKNIFSVALKLNKEQLIAAWRREERNFGTNPWQFAGREIPNPEKVISQGLGNQIGIHLYDSVQLFDFNFSSFLAQAIGPPNNRFLGGNSEVLMISMLVASLNSPVYVSLPVQDTKVVDDFLDELDGVLATLARQPERGFFFGQESVDFYQLEAGKQGPKVRAFAFQFGPLKWRFFWSRIGNGLYVASKKFILDDLVAAEAEQAKAASTAKKPAAGDKTAARTPRGHAMVRIRPENWNAVLADFQLGWAENNRRACLNNLGPLSNVARAYVAVHPEVLSADPAKAGAEIVRQAAQLYGVDFDSPDGGQYLLAADGKSVTHSIYGSAAEPRQPPTLNQQGSAAKLLGQFAGATAELEFLEDGLHAVLTLEKKPQEKP